MGGRGFQHNLESSRFRRAKCGVNSALLLCWSAGKWPRMMGTSNQGDEKDEAKSKRVLSR